MSDAFKLANSYLHLRPDDSAEILSGGQEFWARDIHRPELRTGRLMGAVDQLDDWSHWERHPSGDEILTLLSGAMTLVLEEPAGERRVDLAPGDTLVVPRGVWHRGIVRAPGRLLFITPGAATDHRPV